MLGGRSRVSLASSKLLLRLLTKYLIVQFELNLLLLFLPNPPGNEQIKRLAYKGKIMMVRVSLKNLAHITMFTNIFSPDRGLGALAFVPITFFLSKQTGLSRNLKNLPVLLCQIGLTMSVYPTSLLGSNDMKGCV